jgi:uncharacterized protein YcbK (DUF882 family)
MNALGIPSTPKSTYTSLQDAKNAAMNKAQTPAQTMDDAKNVAVNKNTQVPAPKSIRDYIETRNQVNDIAAQAAKAGKPMSPDLQRALQSAAELGVDVTDVSVIGTLSLAVENKTPLSQIEATVRSLQATNPNAVNKAANQIGIGIAGCAGGGCTTEQTNAQALRGLAEISNVQEYQAQFTGKVAELKSVESYRSNLEAQKDKDAAPDAPATAKTTQGYTDYGKSRTAAQNAQEAAAEDAKSKIAQNCANCSNIAVTYSPAKQDFEVTYDKTGVNDRIASVNFNDLSVEDKAEVTGAPTVEAYQKNVTDVKQAWYDTYTPSTNNTTLTDKTITDAYTDYGKSRVAAQNALEAAASYNRAQLEQNCKTCSNVSITYSPAKQDFEVTYTEKTRLQSLPVIGKLFGLDKTVNFNNLSAADKAKLTGAPSVQEYEKNVKDIQQDKYGISAPVEVDEAARTTTMNAIAKMKQQDNALVDTANLFASKVPGLSTKDSFVVASEFTRTIEGEVGAKGTPQDRAAVASVLMNRLNLALATKKEVSIHDILNDFDITSQDTERTAKFMSKNNQYATTDFGTPAYDRGLQALNDALNGKLPADMPANVKNATHYFNPALGIPSWAIGKPQTKYGPHSFVNADVSIDAVSKARQDVAAGKVKATDVSYETDASVIDKEVAKMREVLGKNPSNISAGTVVDSVTGKPTDPNQGPYSYLFSKSTATLEDAFNQMPQAARDKAKENIQALKAELAPPNTALYTPTYNNKFSTEGIDPKTLQALEEIASSLPFGITVTSAVRDPNHNKKVNGAKLSQHLSGKAFDISLEGLTQKQQQQLIDAVLSNPAVKGFGFYLNGSIHFDTRDTIVGKGYWATDIDRNGQKSSKDFDALAASGKVPSGIVASVNAWSKTGTLDKATDASNATKSLTPQEKARFDGLSSIEKSIDKANENAKNITNSVEKTNTDTNLGPVGPIRNLQLKAVDALTKTAKSIINGVKNLLGITSSSTNDVPLQEQNVGEKNGSTTSKAKNAVAKKAPTVVHKFQKSIEEMIDIIFDNAINVGTIQSDSGYLASTNTNLLTVTRVFTIENTDYEVEISYSNRAVQYVALSLTSVIAGEEHTSKLYDYGADGTVDLQYVNDRYITAQSVLDAGQQRYTLEFKRIAEYLDSHR